MNRSLHTNVIRYGSAVIGVLLATIARLALDPVLGDMFPFATLFFAVLIVAGYGGRGPALLATVLGAVASARFLLPPRDSFAVHGVENQAGLVLYLAISLGIAILGGAMQSARRRAEAHAEEAVRQREQSQITLASIGDAVLVTDSEGRVTSVNPVAEALTGWSASEAAGQPLPSVFRIVNEESRLEVENPALRSLREGLVVGLANHTVLIARDGSERPIDDSAAPIKDDRGSVVGVVLVFRDVSERRRAEAEVGRQAKLLSGILAASVDHIYLVDREGRYGAVSDGGARTLGLDAAAMRGKNWRELGLPAEVMEPFDAQREQVLRSGLPASREVAFRTPEGDERLFEYAIAPVVWGDGDGDGVVVISRDVTERRHAERAIRRGEERTRSILESITDAFCAFDRDWRFTYVNRQAEALLGRPGEDLLGKDHWEEYPATIGTEVERNYRRAVAEDVAVSFEVFYPPHDRWYEINAYPSEEGLSVYFRDATGRRRLADALEAERRRLAAVVENIPAGIVLAEAPSGRMVLINPRVHEILRRPVLPSEGVEDYGRFVAYHPDGRLVEPHEWPLARALRGEVRDGDELLVERGDGTTAWVRVSGAPIRDKEGGVAGGVVAFYDVDAEKRSQEALRESEGQLRRAVEDAPIPIMMHAEDGEVLRISKAWTRLSGYSAGDIPTFRAWLDRAYGPQAGDVEASVRQVFDQGGGMSEREFVITTKWGERRAWDFTASAPGRLPDGRKFLVGMATDVTERRRAERDAHFLAEASAGLAAIVDEASTLQKVANLAVPFFADWCSVDMADEGGQIRRLAVAHIDPAKVELAHDLHRRYPPDPDAANGVAEVIRTGESAWSPRSPTRCWWRGCRTRSTSASSGSWA